jgi:hypothetical protein
MSLQEEKHSRKMEIAAKYQMTKNIQGYLLLVMILLVLSVSIGWWAFGNFNDPLLSGIGAETKSILGWVAVVVGTISLLASGLLVWVIRNARKHVKMLIADFDKRYPNSKYYSDVNTKKRK